MNTRELRFLSQRERALPDATTLPFAYLIKAILIKARRRLYGRWADRHDRFAWTVTSVSDADPAAANVRNYHERQSIREILSSATGGRTVARACEIGCGYGRVIMVLTEFAREVVGFEREEHLLSVARQLLPRVRFVGVGGLDSIPDEAPFDLVMTCTVLQHLTDEHARQVMAGMQRLAPRGHVLCIEKTEPFEVTSSWTDGQRFISRARTIAQYEDMMRPFVLVATRDRVVEPTFSNPRPGTCMLFASPLATRGAS